MSLYDRLIGVSTEPSIGYTNADRPVPKHTFEALLGEIKRGKITLNQAATKLANLERGFTFTAAESSKLQQLINALAAELPGTVKHYSDVSQLTELGWYTKAEALASLGLTE